MFILGKLLNIRDEGNEVEGEMSLLEHLDDLRKMIVRVIITLALGIIICFCFRNNLMEIMRKPIDRVWSLQLNKSLHKLPVEIDAATWEKAGKAANMGVMLEPEQRNHLFNSLSEGDKNFTFHVESLIYYRSALAVKDKKDRKKYIETLPDISPQMRDQLLALAKKYDKSNGLSPDPDADSRRRLVFMQSLHPTEGFMLSFKLALYAGIALTFPFLLYFILQFILPGLHKKERKVLFPSLIIGFALFLGGVVFAYTLVLPRALEFFSSFSGGMGISNDWRIGDYISFTTQFVLIFGLAFELPVLVMALVVLDFLSYTTMAKSRSYAIVGILVAAAVITPTPDAMTLGLLAVPMYLLYEICIILAWFLEKRRSKQNAIKEAQEEEERRAYAEQRAKAIAAGEVSPDHLEPAENSGKEEVDDHGGGGDSPEPDNGFNEVSGNPALQEFNDDDHDDHPEEDFYDEEHYDEDYYDEDDMGDDYYTDPMHINEAFREQSVRIKELEALLKEKLAKIDEVIKDDDGAEGEPPISAEVSAEDLEGAEPALDPEAEAREAGGADLDDDLDINPRKDQ